MTNRCTIILFYLLLYLVAFLR